MYRVCTYMYLTGRSLLLITMAIVVCKPVMTDLIETKVLTHITLSSALVPCWQNFKWLSSKHLRLYNQPISTYSTVHTSVSTRSGHIVPNCHWGHVDLQINAQLPLSWAVMFILAIAWEPCNDFYFSILLYGSLIPNSIPFKPHLVFGGSLAVQ